VLNPSLTKGLWTPAEDTSLLSLVEKHGPKRWSLIAQHLDGRNGKQCRERWHNHLDPSICKDPFTAEEDAILLAAHAKLGNRWAEISQMLQGRTDNAVKNRWHSSLKKCVASDDDGSPSSPARARKRKSSSKGQQRSSKRGGSRSPSARAAAKRKSGGRGGSGSLKVMTSAEIARFPAHEVQDAAMLLMNTRIPTPTAARSALSPHPSALAAAQAGANAAAQAGGDAIRQMAAAAAAAKSHLLASGRASRGNTPVDGVLSSMRLSSPMAVHESPRMLHARRPPPAAQLVTPMGRADSPGLLRCLLFSGRKGATAAGGAGTGKGGAGAAVSAAAAGGAAARRSGLAAVSSSPARGAGRGSSSSSSRSRSRSSSSRSSSSRSSSGRSGFSSLGFGASIPGMASLHVRLAGHSQLLLMQQQQQRGGARKQVVVIPAGGRLAEAEGLGTGWALTPLVMRSVNAKRAARPRPQLRAPLPRVSSSSSSADSFGLASLADAAEIDVTSRRVPTPRFIAQQRLGGGGVPNGPDSPSHMHPALIQAIPSTSSTSASALLSGTGVTMFHAPSTRLLVAAAATSSSPAKEATASVVAPPQQDGGRKGGAAAVPPLPECKQREESPESLIQVQILGLTGVQGK